MKTLPWTGERYLPWGEDPVTAYEHWHRYAFAAQFAAGRRVLDVASGEGYGSALLAATARQVVAFDIDQKAVHHARLKYPGANLEFVAGSVVEIPLHGIEFDLIVCFEAIEHIPDPEALLQEVKRMLGAEGIFIVSTPNKPEYKKMESSNPFHVKEFDFEEFRKLLSRYFKQMCFLGQRVYCNSSLWPMIPKGPGMIAEHVLDRNDAGFSLSDAEKRVPLYFVGIASDAITLPDITGAVLVDSSNSLLKEAERIQEETAAKVQSREEALAWKEDQLNQAQATVHSREQALAWKEEQLQQAQAAIHSREQALAWKEEQWKQAQATIASHEQALAWRESQVTEQTRAIQVLQGETERLAAELNAIKSGRLWRSIQKILRIRNRLLPSGSHRRALYNRLTGSKP